MHVRGDKDAAYGQMVAVMDELASNGITHIAIVTELGKKETGKPGSGKPAGARSPAAPVAPEPEK